MLLWLARKYVVTRVSRSFVTVTARPAAVRGGFGISIFAVTPDSAANSGSYPGGFNRAGPAAADAAAPELSLKRWRSSVVAARKPEAAGTVWTTLWQRGGFNAVAGDSGNFRRIWISKIGFRWHFWLAAQSDSSEVGYAMERAERPENGWRRWGEQRISICRGGTTGGCAGARAASAVNRGAVLRHFKMLAGKQGGRTG